MLSDSYSARSEAGEMEERTTERTEWFVVLDGDAIDIKTFAGRCIEEWDRFLIGQGLLRT
jgi:hypothetical protein